MKKTIILILILLALIAVFLLPDPKPDNQKYGVCSKFGMKTVGVVPDIRCEPWEK